MRPNPTDVPVKRMSGRMGARGTFSMTVKGCPSNSFRTKGIQFLCPRLRRCSLVSVDALENIWHGGLTHTASNACTSNGSRAISAMMWSAG